MDEMLKEHILNNGKKIDKCLDKISDVEIKVVERLASLETVNSRLKTIEDEQKKHDDRIWKIYGIVSGLSFLFGLIGDKAAKLLP